mmetsp:Transcript_40049/g.58519  ORF Transcript_40049/g.58519 Transcript_40049/m.58519 type:complete len:497 (-) Transcript_40049:293-1783(-)
MSSSRTETKSNKTTKWYNGIGGLNPNFSLFGIPPTWVNTSLPPGHTSQSAMLSTYPEWRTLLTGTYILYSLNLVWLLIAIWVYIVFPYDYEVAKHWDSHFGHWIVKRAVVNMSIVHLYYSFWHVSLYGLKWSTRPFNTNRVYRWDKLLHNMWYTTLGTLQWTAWEALMLYCYATGRMPYLSNEEAFTSLCYGTSHFLICIIAVPLYREVHFYFAHRLIHIRSLYTYVHSVHHRNTDVEPFSGLCMHPIEHLYYFTSIALPSLYLRVTPFAFLWNGVHLILSPGASHSGWEDHVDSDQYHYLHHRYFECNYGTPSLLLDCIFGTFRDKLSDKSDTTTYQGDADGVGDVTARKLDGKASLLGLPDWDQFVYNLLFCVMTPAIYVMALIGPSSSSSAAPFNNPSGVAFLVVIAPIIGGILLGLVKSWVKRKKRRESLKRLLSYPFHKDAFSNLGMHIVIGVMIGVLPAYHLFHMSLSEVGKGAYFQLWACITREENAMV